MTDFLDRLFHTTDVKAFSALAKEAETKYPNPEAFLEEVASYLPVRLYERYYGDSAPHSFFGLIAAEQVRSLFSEESRWKPFIQQAWFVTKETKRTPWDLDRITPRGDGSLDARWRGFETSAAGGDFEEAFAWTKGFLDSSQERDFFRERSLSYAMEDTAFGGYKFLYLIQAWQLAERLKWNHLEKILFPPLHFLVTGPKERELSSLAKEEWRRNPLPALLQNEAPVPSQGYKEFEHSALFATSVEEVFDILRDLAHSGVGLEGIRDALLLAGSQAISNAQLGSWIWPMRAFHFGVLSPRWMDLVEPHRKTYGVIMTAALLNQASERSRESETNRRLDEVAQRLCPTDTLNVLRSVVSHSDPFASATAAYAILGMNEEKKEELFRMLVSLAAKNDGHLCYGNDLLFVQEAIDCYRRSSLNEKDRYIVSLGFFLGRVPKKYELFSVYGK